MIKKILIAIFLIFISFLFVRFCMQEPKKLKDIITEENVTKIIFTNIDIKDIRNEITISEKEEIKEFVSHIKNSKEVYNVIERVHEGFLEVRIYLINNDEVYFTMLKKQTGEVIIRYESEILNVFYYSHENLLDLVYSKSK